MDEERFWAMIEAAWKGNDVAGERAALLDAATRDAAAARLPLKPFLASLKSALQLLDVDHLMAFDAILERKLYDIDRADVHEALGGSDDGFLYARGFVVAAGRAYYDAVNRDPQRGVPEAECEEICYLPCTVHNEEFGEWPELARGISRESTSNALAWA